MRPPYAHDEERFAGAGGGWGWGVWSETAVTLIVKQQQLHVHKLGGHGGGGGGGGSVVAWWRVSRFGLAVRR